MLALLRNLVDEAKLSHLHATSNETSQTAQCRHRLAQIIPGYIYAIGTGLLSVMERYDQVHDQWTYVAI